MLGGTLSSSDIAGGLLPVGPTETLVPVCPGGGGGRGSPPGSVVMFDPGGGAPTIATPRG